MTTGRPHPQSSSRQPQGRVPRLSVVAAAVSATFALATLPLPVGAAQDGAGPPQKRYAEGRILVQPKAGLPEARLRKLLGEEGAKSQKKLDRLKVHVVEVPKGAEEALARKLARHPHVKFAEVDALVPVESLVPNDTYWGNAWHVRKMQADSAWDVTTGSGVTVAVLDTGVDGTHLDLGANLVPGWNVVSNSADTSDVYTHGTRVAGTVAALSNNALGVTSVASGAKVMPVRITNNTDGSASYSDMASGVTWAADHGARVANISYQNVTSSSTVAAAAEYMRSKGGVVVVAAGNSGIDPGYANAPAMITVAATDSADAKASFSNFGNLIDLAAPGVGIYTTAKGGGYSSSSGTSFASPAAAAVAALVMAAKPTLRPSDVETVLKTSADDLGTAGWDPYFGYGRVNAAKAVSLAAQAVVSDTQAPKVSIASPAAGTTVQEVVTVDVTASDDVGVARVDLYANNALVASDSGAPYSFAWDASALAAGSSVTLTAKAYDAANNAATSTAISVKIGGAADSVPPTVAISSPYAGATVDGTVTLSASGSDDKQLSSVSIFFDGKLVCSAANNPSCGFNTRKVKSGTHTVSATAKDAAGLSTTASITVKK